MKILIISFISSFIFAATGIVKVLEAPLLQEEDEKSRIIQKIRMGKKIFVNANSINSNSDFYQTVSKDGRTLFIKKDFVKIRHSNLSELNESIYLKHDPTNYLLAEPIPEGYPLKLYSFNKASIDLTYGQSTNARYEYATSVQREQFNPSISLSMRYLRNPKFDLTNRLYYGFNLGVRTERNEFQITESLFSNENHLKLYIGPSFTYSVYRREKFELDFIIELAFNFQNSYIKQESTVKKEAEELNFTGRFLSANTGISFVHKKAFDVNDLDIIHGPLLTFNSPYTLLSSGNPTIIELWPSNSVSVASDFSLSYRLGFTIRY